MKKRKVSRKVSRTSVSDKGYSGRKGFFRSSPVPVFVKVISLLYYITAVLAIITGIVLFVDGIGLANWRNGLGAETIFGYNLNPVSALVVGFITINLVVAGLLHIALGVFQVFIGNSLLRGKNWARILTIVFMVLSLANALINLDIITTILSCLIGSYLWLDRGVKRVFVR